MPARHLVLGLDGADLDLIHAFGPSALPALHGLMERGAFARLQSVAPPATLPNWTTFLTGTDPGVHGVFDFTTRRGYRVRFTAGTVREAPTLAARLDRLGLRCACIGFPATWPPEPLDHGVFVSGWDAPVAFEADRSFVWPQALYDVIVERFGVPRFDDVDEFDASAPGWHRSLPGALVDRVDRRAGLAEWLIEQRDWDLFAVYFGESDTAAHHLFSLHDPGSPRHPLGTTARERDGLGRVYASLDDAVGRLLAAAGGERVEVTVVSDHGSGGASDKVLYLNRALAEADFLRFRRSGMTDLATRFAKDLAVTRLPPRLRERLFRGAGALLPGLLESRARFGGIDLRRTVAFSDELNYFPAIHLNVRGREPLGQIGPTDLPTVRRDVTEALLALRDPWSGNPAIARVTPREELFRGPFVHRAPDLLLELALDGGYSYNLQPSGGAPPGVGPFRRLAPAEYLGRKGRSLPGSHRSHGVYVAAGPRVAPVGEIGAHIADATATLLARMDVAVPEEAAGRVLFECLQENAGTPGRVLPAAPVQRGATPDETRIERRLRALGYVD